MVVRGVVIMLDITEMKKLLKASLPHKRFKHSLAVYDTALELAAVYGLDKEKVGVGALLHDCGREIPTRDLLMHTIALGLPMDDVERNQPILLHAKLGVYYAREKYGVTDQEILDAIRFHTTGAAGGAGAMFPFGVVVEHLAAVEAGNDTFSRAPTYRFDNFGIGPAFLRGGQRWQFLACFDCLLLEFISRFHGVSN